jgi:Methyladenine glycosylase
MVAEPRSWLALDVILKHCADNGLSAWHSEFASRGRTSPRRVPPDCNILRHFCIAIAFSQNAQSRQVNALIQTPAFCNAFAHFDPVTLARSNPDSILNKYWAVLNPIRFRGKVKSIVACAKVLVQIAHQHGSFARYLNQFGIPKRLVTIADIDLFWHGFDRLQGNLRLRGMPFFRSTVSLLQLLLDLDFDSVKPDLIVMRLACRIQLVPTEHGNRMFREVVHTIQKYALMRGLRPNQLDLALLAFGGQTNARLLLRTPFCPRLNPCHNVNCRVGKQGLCRAYNRTNLASESE